jgi:UDP-2,3-diacylglucosamine hydrolase
MRQVFIADAHLGKPGDFNYRTLLKFLEGLKGNTETLFILGDLFEFWIGYRNIPYTHYLPALAILKELRDKGTHIIYFEGNHDFHMGHFFENVLQAEIYPGPVILSINGKKVYLCHGDQILRNDYGYLAFRFLLHNPLTKILFPLVPYRLTSMIARLLSNQSLENHDERNRKLNYEAIVKDFASARFESGCNAVITAHFHYPFIDKIGTDKDERILISLGDWKTQFSYGEWIDGSLALKKYSA